MENIFIKPTFESPEVIFNAQENELIIKGKSFSDNVLPVYIQITEIIDGFVTENKSTTLTAIFELIYFNTASAKSLYSLFVKLQSLKQQGVNVKIVWKYQENDEEIKEAGEQFQELLENGFELIPIVVKNE